MGILRLFAGPVVHRISPVGLLWVCSILTAVGLFTMGYARNAPTVLVTSTIFAVGVTFYWPTMLGITSERFPKGGAFLLAVIGGTGMLSAGVAQPVMGRINDYYTKTELRAEAPELYTLVEAEGIEALTQVEAEEDVARIDSARAFGAKMTFRWVTVLPVLLLIIYGAIWLYDKSRGGYQAVKLKEDHGMPEPQR
jgi:MFS family permease